MTHLPFSFRSPHGETEFEIGLLSALDIGAMADGCEECDVAARGDAGFLQAKLDRSGSLDE